MYNIRNLNVTVNDRKQKIIDIDINKLLHSPSQIAGVRKF